jgi:PAS domain S-box-containing protein
MYQPVSKFDVIKDILLIEDDRKYARLIEVLLSESELIHCRLVHCTSLAEGIRQLSGSTSFAAVLLDLSLPDSQGIDTLLKLREAFPQQNVIVLTGRNDRAIGIKMVKAGAQDFLEKGGFKEEDLVKTLLFAIERNAILSRLEETQKAAKIGHWECSPENHHFHASEEVYRIMDVPASRTTFSCEELMASSCPLHFLVALHDRVPDQGALEDTLTITTGGGKTLHLSIRCRKENLPGNQPFYNGIIQDVTDLIKAKQDRSKSQEKYLEIFKQTKDAIFSTTPEGKIIDFNTATSKLLGLPPTAIGHEANIFALCYPEDRRLALKQQLQSGSAIQDFEIKIIQPGGERRICMIDASPSSQRPLQYNFLVHDITQLRQSEALRVARDIALERAKVREQVIASVSHELRTPMNAILGMINLLERDNLNDTQKQYLESIHQSSELLLGIVNDILLASSIKHNKLQFQKKPFRFRQLLRSLEDMMRQQLNDKPIRFDITVAPDVPDHLIGDALRLNQILYNLLGNAIKFTEEGSVALTAGLKNQEDDQVQLCFKVIDTGLGIAPEKLEDIFLPFARVHAKDRIIEGTGLGLSIVRDLVHLQGGAIKAESTVGEGSVFCVELWFQISAHAAAATKRAMLPPVIQQQDYHFLIVEDHQLNQIVAKRTLQLRWPNARIDVANNGREAIGLTKDTNFDLILMDIQMPEMDGIETAIYIRKKQKKTTPILAMTAQIYASKTKEYELAQFNDTILKPFDPQQLYHTIEKHLEKQTSHA